MNQKKFVLLILVLLIVTSGLIYWVYLLSRSSNEIPGPKVIESSPTHQIQGIAAVDDLNDLVYSPAKNQFLITSFDESKIYILDAESFSITGEVEIGFPHKLLIPELLSEIYISVGGGRVLKVSADTFSVLGQAEVGKKPSEMVYDATRGRLFVINEFSNSVSVIESGSFEVTRTIPVGERPVNIEMDRRGELIYVSNDRDGSVSIISVDGLQVVDTIFEVGRPGKLLAYPGKDLVLVLDRFNNQLLVIDQSVGQVAARIGIVNYPVDMVLDQKAEKLYVASFTENSIGVIDLKKEKMVEVIQLGSSFESNGGLNNIALMPGGDQLMVTNTNTGQVYIVEIK